MSYVFLAIVMSISADDASTRSIPTPCKQTVIVTGRAFVRCGNHRGAWQQWQETFLPPAGARSWTHKTSEWPRSVKQGEVQRILGERNWAWFEKNKQVRQSGYFNLSGNPGYDWPEYAGEHFP